MTAYNHPDIWAECAKLPRLCRLNVRQQSGAERPIANDCDRGGMDLWAFKTRMCIVELAWVIREPLYMISDIVSHSGQQCRCDEIEPTAYLGVANWVWRLMVVEVASFCLDSKVGLMHDQR